MKNIFVFGIIISLFTSCGAAVLLIPAVGGAGAVGYSVLAKKDSTQYASYNTGSSNQVAEKNKKEEEEKTLMSKLAIAGYKNATVEKDIFGDYIVKDGSSGSRTTVKVEKNIFGDYEIRDDKGNKRTLEKDIFGDYSIKDDKGNKATIEKDIFGDYIIKDEKGNKTTAKKDIFGDYIIEDSKGNKTTIKKEVFEKK